jgi:hypothetical protein
MGGPVVVFTVECGEADRRVLAEQVFAPGWSPLTDPDISYTVSRRNSR